MSGIDAIYRQGDDALGNQFEINFSAISFIPEVDRLKLRTINVDIPEFSVETYTVDYKTQRFTKPSGKISTPNEFTFTIRVDKYWTLYKALLAWHLYIADTSNGAMAEDVGAISGESGIRTDITIIPTDANDIPTSDGWKMHKCFPSLVPGVSFDMASGEPLTIAITMQMLKMTENL